MQHLDKSVIFNQMFVFVFTVLKCLPQAAVHSKSVFGVVGTIKILQGGEMASDNVLGGSDDPLLSTGKLVVRKPSLAILPPTRMASCYQWRASPQNMKG